MKTKLFMAFLFTFGISPIIIGCAEEGKEGTTGIDCGEHGSEHAGHCHCDEGYLFDGETCVAPEAITEICHTPDGGAESEEAHHHEACRCPDEGECHCDDGEITTFGGRDYCVPELD